MIRKLLMFLFILPILTFSRGQIITLQPVNDSVCLTQQEAVFNLASKAPDVVFTWEYRTTSTGTWTPITESMPDFSGIDNDTLRAINAGNYSGFEFRCALHDAFTGTFMEYSNTVKIVTIQPPASNFGINQLAVETDCYTLCPDVYISFVDLTENPFEITDWLWEFGDGSISVFQNPNHQYLQPGEYTVTLTAWNLYGCSSSVQKQVKVMDINDLTINGPEIICGNQLSDERNLYYSVTPVCDTCVYEWKLPENYVLSSEQIDAGTIRIHWGTVEEAVQLILEVTEQNTACDRECQTGHAVMDILLKAQQSPDPAFKVIRKAEDNAILIYLGQDMVLYRWGSTDKTIFTESFDLEWNDNFYDFGSLDLNKFDYWVETSESASGECWTRSYYR